MYLHFAWNVCLKGALNLAQSNCVGSSTMRKKAALIYHVIQKSKIPKENTENNCVKSKCGIYNNNALNSHSFSFAAHIKFLMTLLRRTMQMNATG